MLPKQKIFNIGITNAIEKEILEYIVESVERGDEKYYVVTPNPEILVYGTKHKDFKTILNNARLAFADGTGVMWAGRFMGKPFKERVTGTDFMLKLCNSIFEKPITVGFLGGRGGVAEKTVECLKSKYPTLKVAFIGEKWSQEGFILESKFIDILFVAFGFPRQEEWMAKNLPNIPVKVAVGVGGAFDYISGKVPRAPLFIRNLGFEWLYRLICQPWRIKRQLALLEFVYLVLKEKTFFRI